VAKKQRVESLSYPIIKHSIEREGGFYYKPADTGYVGGNENRFSPKRPCDIIGIISWGTLIIEMKGFRDVKCISLKDLRPSQIETFEKILYPGNPHTFSLVGYYFYIPNKLKKIVFVEYDLLKHKELIPVKEVRAFLDQNGNGAVYSENILNPETGKESRKYFIHMNEMQKYQISG
jgi:hypothetical protein